MKHTAQDILNYVEDNDVKFVRLAFCDIFGNQKNISVFAGDLPYAFEQGVCFDGSSIAGFMNTEESDLVLWPDPDTMTILPWRPTGGPRDAHVLRYHPAQWPPLCRQQPRVPAIGGQAHQGHGPALRCGLRM